jgi:hypothetical protein
MQRQSTSFGVLCDHVPQAVVVIPAVLVYLFEFIHTHRNRKGSKLDRRSRRGSG